MGSLYLQTPVGCGFKNNGLTNLETWTVAVNSSNEIFVGTWDGIFRSTDNAENWVKLETGLTFNQIREITVASNGYILQSLQIMVS